MSKANKILLILVIILFLALVGLVVWQKWGKFGFEPSYWAVYLRTGDLYFGKLTQFPYFGLKNVYTFQVNQQDTQNPISIQRFANVFWGPQDFLKINRNEVVWMTKLNSKGQLAELLKTNPDLQSSLQPNSPIPTPAGNEDDTNAKDTNSSDGE